MNTLPRFHGISTEAVRQTCFDSPDFAPTRSFGIKIE
jgi:hypothetical protein